MAKVIFFPSNRSVEVRKGTSIFEAARVAGVSIPSSCKGIGTCGKCKVRIDEGSLSNIRSYADQSLPGESASQRFVLSCLTQIKDDISVSVEGIGARVSSGPNILAYARAVNVELDGFIRKRFTEEEGVTRVYGGDDLLGIEEGNTEDRNYGVVVDIGTTALVASIVDINTGKEIKSVSSTNPQFLHAEDVLSRIAISSEESGLALMYSEITGEINRMIEEAAGSSRVARENLYEIIYTGNTCMLHLATCVSPRTLGEYPYRAQISGGSHLRAEDHNLAISDFGVIYLPPIISPYVGADITSGILASGFHRYKGTAIFLDIGTNGEMVLAHHGKLSATSTAAGPAFEGMNIACGMRADNGAVERFAIEEDGSIALKTIGESRAVGLCGSGLVDVVSELVSHALIKKNGRLANPRAEPGLPPALKERLRGHEGMPAFMIADGVYLSQRDVRQVQLAKGAIRSGVEVLLRHRGIKASDVERILVAGAFGYFLRSESLLNIGLLPGEFEGRIEFVGNTSQSGGRVFLLNRASRREMRETVESVEVLDLARFPGFDKVFTKCLGF